MRKVEVSGESEYLHCTYEGHAWLETVDESFDHEFCTEKRISYKVVSFEVLVQFLDRDGEVTCTVLNNKCTGRFNDELREKIWSEVNL